MVWPPTHSFRYITQARCSLTAWPEWCLLHTETGCMIGAFLFKDVLCRWGAVEEIVTDNGTPHIFWADHTTVRKSTGHSPFYMAHGVKPLFTFDITLATFLIPELTRLLSTTKLIATRARQLKMHEDDLAAIRDNVLKSHLTSM